MSPASQNMPRCWHTCQITPGDIAALKGRETGMGVVQEPEWRHKLHSRVARILTALLVAWTSSSKSGHLGALEV